VRKLTVSLAVLASALAIGIVPAGAITDGTPDGNGHPHVGLMVAKNSAGQPLWRCSGTLLSSRVFLTAGHCTEAPAASAEIWFAPGPVNNDPDYVAVAAGGTGCDNPAVDGYPCDGDATASKIYTHPNYDPNAFFLRDLGVAVIDSREAQTRTTYGVLPQRDQLDVFDTSRGQQNVTFTAVGYGLQKSFPDAASWKDEAQRTRMVAYPKLDQINTGFVGDFSLLLSNNANTGGTCFGDSGGPNFLGTTNVIAAITITGDAVCRSKNVTYRLDTQSARAFLGQFVTLP
jgi:Trypsin